MTQLSFLQTECFVFDASLVHGAMFLKASLHGSKRKRGGWGRAQPPICKLNVLLTGSERVHMVASRMMLEATLLRLEKWQYNTI